MTTMKAEIEAMRAVLLVGGLALDKAHHGPEDSRATLNYSLNLEDLFPIFSLLNLWVLLQKKILQP